jgi:hypothetical protein
MMQGKFPTSIERRKHIFKLDLHQVDDRSAQGRAKSLR